MNERTTAVCQTILVKQPDFVFLQEVVDASKSIIERKLKSRYNCYAPPSPSMHYFVVILVKKVAHLVVSAPLHCYNFPDSTMGRHLLQLLVNYCGVNIFLMTSHLESLKDHSRERKNQLRKAFDVMVERREVCIFGGDLNLREPEVRSVKVPQNIVDVWEECGAPPDTRYTWDVSANDNLHWPYPNRPKARYDRVYLAPKERVLEPSSFELVGQDRLPECGRFCSDHWGLCVDFDIQL